MTVCCTKVPSIISRNFEANFLFFRFSHKIISWKFDAKKRQLIFLETKLATFVHNLRALRERKIDFRQIFLTILTRHCKLKIIRDFILLLQNI